MYVCTWVASKTFRPREGINSRLLTFLNFLFIPIAMSDFAEDDKAETACPVMHLLPLSLHIHTKTTHFLCSVVTVGAS